jgi:hypothetical protein
MAIRPCENEGRIGSKWGEDGVCYTGKDARKNALKQGIAEELASKHFDRGAFADFSKSEINEAISEMDLSLSHKLFLSSLG